MKQIQELAIAVGLLILALAVGLVGMRYIAVKEREVKNAARFQCAQSSRYEATDGASGVTTWYPIKDLYEACLKEKGL